MCTEPFNLKLPRFLGKVIQAGPHNFFPGSEVFLFV